MTVKKHKLEGACRRIWKQWRPISFNSVPCTRSLLRFTRTLLYYIHGIQRAIVNLSEERVSFCVTYTAVALLFFSIVLVFGVSVSAGWLGWYLCLLATTTVRSTSSYSKQLKYTVVQVQIPPRCFEAGWLTSLSWVSSRQPPVCMKAVQKNLYFNPSWIIKSLTKNTFGWATWKFISNWFLLQNSRSKRNLNW